MLLTLTIYSEAIDVSLQLVPRFVILRYYVVYPKSHLIHNTQLCASMSHSDVYKSLLIKGFGKFNRTFGAYCKEQRNCVYIIYTRSSSNHYSVSHYLYIHNGDLDMVGLSKNIYFTHMIIF